jgi:RimJ/RimL family protein N-acetyltransferase
MTWATDRIHLEDEYVQIQNFGRDECPAIARAVRDPNGWYERNLGLDTLEKVQVKLLAGVEEQALGRSNTFVHRVRGEVVGTSRYHRIDADAKTLEIGSTWVASKWKRTFANTAVKRLLLRQAFEGFGAERVEFRVNSRNYASQMAVLRLGATFEGKLRHAVSYPGFGPQDAHLYSITKSEWPWIERRLGALLKRETPEAKFLPTGFESERLRIRQYRLEDAAPMLELVRRNRRELLPSFPSTAAFQTELDAKEFIAEKAHLAAKGESFFYGVFELRSGSLIGQLSIKNIDWKAGSAEFGYYVDVRRQGAHYATEFLKRAVLELEKRNFKRLVVRILPDNVASLSCIGKIGFEIEGIVKSAFLTGTKELSDVVQLSRIAPQVSKSRPIDFWREAGSTPGIGLKM